MSQEKALAMLYMAAMLDETPRQVESKSFRLPEVAAQPQPVKDRSLHRPEGAREKARHAARALGLLLHQAVRDPTGGGS